MSSCRLSIFTSHGAHDGNINFLRKTSFTKENEGQLGANTSNSGGFSRKACSSVSLDPVFRLQEDANIDGLPWFDWIDNCKIKTADQLDMLTH